MRLAVLSSHPIQYQAPLFRELSRRMELTVFFAHRATPTDQARAGFGVRFDWDIDLLDGYEHCFLRNVANPAGLDRFAGMDTPEIGQRLHEGRFDALLVLGWHRKTFIQGIWAAKRLRLPVMVRGDSQLHTPRSPLKRVVKASIYPFLLRQFDAALYVGQRSQAYYQYYRYPEERLFFSPHCVDSAWFTERATTEAGQALRLELCIGPNEKVILFAGKLVPFKRPLDVIDAGAVLRGQGMTVRVLIAGTGQMEEQIRHRAEASGLPLHLLGFRNQTQMPAAYAAADVLVLPSDGGETWGLVANEALACGRPIVVSDACGCAPDLAGDGAAGRVFPCGNVKELAKTLDNILSSPPLPAMIRAKSDDYGLSAAGNGIREAVSALTGERRDAPRSDASISRLRR